MSQPGDRLYNLLPVIYRQRDEIAGQPLRALLAVIENEFNLLEANIGATYNNWFIETCDAWVIPYLADLVGIDDQTTIKPPFFGQRRLVANHIAYQRRKGLATILAHVARDVSGWHAFVIDLSQRVAHTESVKNVTPASGKTVDLRQGEQLALFGTAFDSATRTADVRRINADTQIGARPGMASPNALALYLWRLQSYPVRQSQSGVQAHIHRGNKTRHFTFDPLGRDITLFIQPEAIENLSAPMRPAHFPQPLSRALLAADLADHASRPDPLDTTLGPMQTISRYYGPQQEIAIWKEGSLVPAHEILSGHIDRRNTDYWDALIQDLHDQGEEKTAVVDPENGLFLLAKAVSRDEVKVNYTYGFSSDVGSGPYLQAVPDDRDEPARSAALRIDILRSSVDADVSETRKTASSLEKALEYWENLCEGCRDSGKTPQAIIRFLDSGTYHLPGPLRTVLPSGSYLSIEAAAGERPTIIAETGRLGMVPGISVQELVVFDRRLRLQGLLIKGPVAIPNLTGGKLDFQIRSCTLLDDLDLQISETVLFDFKISASMIESICVKITGLSPDLAYGFAPAANRQGSLGIEDSIARLDVTTLVNALTPYDFLASINRSTIFGAAHLSSISQISDAIVMGGIQVENKGKDQNGNPAAQPVVLRYSHAAETNLPETAFEYCVIGRQIQPLFTSTHPTHAGYAQLRSACPKQIGNGASNGAEMGAFNSLQVDRREANLMRMLPDYLPLGQNLGIFNVT